MRGAGLTVSKMTLDGFFIKLVLDGGSLKVGGMSDVGATAVINHCINNHSVNDQKELAFNSSIHYDQLELSNKQVD